MTTHSGVKVKGVFGSFSQALIQHTGFNNRTETHPWGFHGGLAFSTVIHTVTSPRNQSKREIRLLLSSTK